MLEIVVHSVQHLPKMDTFGKCDPFVKITYGSEPTVQTQVIKNVWEGFFEEKFGWDLTDSEGKVLLPYPQPHQPTILSFGLS
jgi:hypothetical protein